MKLSSPYLFIFFGAPGAGKGTQTLLIAEQHQLVRIEMSKLLGQKFRNAKEGEYIEIEGKRYVIAEQDERQRKGFLCEAPFVSFLVQKKIQEVYQMGESIVLDGFPRSVEQIEFVFPFLLEKFGKEHIVVLYLDLEEQESIRRNTQRKMCELMRHPILSHPETEGLTICPLDGSRLIKRVDDNVEAMKVRFQEFRNQTLPLIPYLKKNGIPVHTVRAEQSVAEVFLDISKILNDFIA
ncbi:MAG: nucleoside monophosphate kinase [Candidatus Wildermuthbacteria bacterium]|nr:nucleoside monophosphate kinase [Candidatus Wildermuthbacteria bacterium]